MKFLVVVPTIRQGLPGFDETIETIRSSFTHPTEFHVLDGKTGKTQTLNRAFDELLLPSDCDVYATIDDDYLPGKRWQDEVARALDAIPKLGAVAIWMGDSPEMLQCVGAHRIHPPVVENGIRLRRLMKGHHLAGCLIAFRREVAIKVGKVPETAERYQIWEDAWRGRRVQKAGYDLAFIDGDLPRLIEYDDPVEYLQAKEADTAASRQNQDEAMRMGGVSDPWLLRLRRTIAKLRGRI